MIYEQIKTSQESPTLEEIEVCEKVLKWAAEAKFVSFTHEEAKNIMRGVTNILRWNIGETIISLPVESEQ